MGNRDSQAAVVLLRSGSLENEWAHCSDKYLLAVIRDEYQLSHVDADGMIQLVEELQRRGLIECKLYQH